LQSTYEEVPLMTLHATHVDSGADFEIGPDASHADRDLTDRLYTHISRERRPADMSSGACDPLAAMAHVTASAPG
jgi:hypothetical protein